MNVHEYQAKALLHEFGVPVPEGRLATTPEEAEKAAKALGTPVVVVKAQVHAGGRGKAGGVKVVDSPAAAKKAAFEEENRKAAAVLAEAARKAQEVFYKAAQLQAQMAQTEAAARAAQGGH